MVGHKYDRSSGNFGVGLKYQVGERLSLSAGYDLLLEDKYLGHQFNVGSALTF